MYVCVCKNKIATNNKKKWIDPDPTIRVSKTPCGKVTSRSHEIGVLDKDGNVVARLVATTDGEPVISCGAKVALITEYDVCEIK